MNKSWLHWFRQRRRKPFPFQRETWAAYLDGESGLVHAPTGLGKTYAVWGGPVSEWLNEHPEKEVWPAKGEPLRVLWITPLRALANDTVKSLQAPLTDLGIPWIGSGAPRSRGAATGGSAAAFDLGKSSRNEIYANAHHTAHSPGLSSLEHVGTGRSQQRAVAGPSSTNG